MARKNKFTASKMSVDVSRYAPVFKKLRAAMAREYSEKIKYVETEAVGFIRDLREQPFWLDGEYLAKAREEANLSQHDLAQLSGVSRSVIANYETGVITVPFDVATKVYLALEPLGGHLCANGKRGLAEVMAKGTRSIIEMRKREIESLNAFQEESNQSLANWEAEILRLDQKTLLGLCKGWGR